ncbi:Na+-transporting NADH:ubiquinone oxidoreductase subunit B [Aquiflexum balticum DSM 16537]|uniref:Na(+)-translocating NADH-quinone reductase subunit B n=1 Tax=Aquiflexum balticum DSM 16537 TaxID=758820 RepID=A0A1W2H7E2_9BACT|nr:NADH:ubiquinone reductase (Na(+)-transporting) subunit B [Aquiflexum balticum]SMD44845.1 Na+-transporting NADH:ubiquinone oxidoreductase subunit B [Aquiflexum balticum DSM 16537]
MKIVSKNLSKIRPYVEKGGKYEKWFYLFNMIDTILMVPNHTTSVKGVQVSDAIDLKRYMITVVVSLIPVLIFGIWNSGHQHYLAIGESVTFYYKIVLGLELVIPIIIVAYSVGGVVEVTFALVRKHPVNEGFLVTGMLIPLILPVTVPLWQVGLATAFALVIAKEVFGGTGMNILNVAMTARAFLYFSYPSQLSGEIWTYIPDPSKLVDGYSGATALAIAQETVSMHGSGISIIENLSKAGLWSGENLFSFWNMFVGAIPGSIAETSTLACLLGAAILIFTGVGSYKIILSVFSGALVMGYFFNFLAYLGIQSAYFELPSTYHLVMGGLAFAAVYMATDPVTASQTEGGKWIYGFLIGVLTIVIRAVNPAYPEGVMLAVLFMNVFAPLIDYYIVKQNKNRRLKRALR